MSAALQLSAARVWREDAEGGRIVLDGLDLRVEARERVAIVGPNGAGKTTLLLALVGATPFEGKIVVCGRTLDRTTLDAVRATVGLVFADPGDQLFADEVWKEVAFGPEQRGLPEADVRTRTDEALAAVDLGAAVGRHPDELSLGERRRLAIATMLALRPEVLLVDEPTASLDPRARRRILAVLRDLDATVVVATHDLDAALELDARVVMLHGGHVVADGPAARLLGDDAALDRAGLAPPLSRAVQRR